MEDQASTSPSRSALLITHPGHELLVHGWLSTERPLVFVLTDGIGPDRHTAIQATSLVLREAGASPGSIFGRMTEAALERALLQRDFTLFHALTTDLTAALVRYRATRVVGDTAEGECLSHDVWRGVINTAVAIAARYLDGPIANLAFPLFRTEDDTTAKEPPAYERTLDEAQVKAKLRAAGHYDLPPEEFRQRRIKDDCASLRHESLHVVRDDLAVAQPLSARPAYERQGQMQVAAGYSRRVVRFRDHVMPLLTSLRQLRAAG